MADRCNPKGFEGSCRETGYDAQKEQKTNDVNKPNLTVGRESVGKADTKPGPER